MAREAGATNGYFLEGYGTDSKAQAGAGIAAIHGSACPSPKHF